MILNKVINSGYSVLSTKLGKVLLDEEDQIFYPTMVYIKDNIGEIMSSMIECETPEQIRKSNDFNGVSGVYVVLNEGDFHFYIYVNEKWHRTNINLL